MVTGGIEMTQRTAILDYIETHGSITPMEAFGELGVTKLATQISMMIRDGFKVKKEMVHSRNRFNKPCWYMKYSLED